MKKIKYIIFDFGGVYVSEGLKIARKEYGKRIGIDLEKEWHEKIRPYWKALEKGEMAEGSFWSALELLLNEKGFDSREFRKVFAGNQKRNERLVEVICRLRDRGYKTALLTNNVKEWIEDADRKDPLRNYFDIVVSSHEVKEVKPDPAIYDITLKRLNANPQECVFIDDKEKNLVTAREMGMETIIFDETEIVISKLKDMLKEGPL